MSDKFIVEVSKIDNVREHTNATKLQITEIKGWQIVIGKDLFQTGDLVVFIPPDAVLPKELSDRLEVTQYLKSGQRVRPVRLRGEISHGLVISPDDLSWSVGKDVADYYGITKYQPPFVQDRITRGQKRRPSKWYQRWFPYWLQKLLRLPTYYPHPGLPEHPLFPRYTDIENLRHWPDVFGKTDLVYLSEKIHGSSGRIAIIHGKKMAGSHNVRRVKPLNIANPTSSDRDNALYWWPWTVPGVEPMLKDLAQSHKQVVLYGEIYGKDIQKFEYGQTGLAFVAFDLLIDGKFQYWSDLKQICGKYHVPVVPDLGLHLYSLDTIKTLANGKSMLSNDNIREGIIVRPLSETRNPKIGRLILKYCSDDYYTKEIEDIKES